MAVASAVEATDLGLVLLKKIVAFCRAKGTAQMVGFIPKASRSLLSVARDLGCRLADTGDPELLEGRVKLQEAGMEARV